MKKKMLFVLKTFSVLLVAALLLAGGITLMPLMAERTRTFATDDYTPEINIPETEIPVVPESQTQLEGKFGIYTFITEEDGKSVATIYSKTQIRDFVKRRDDGEWFSLTSEEVLFLVSDTLELLENYDIIRLRGLDENITTYFGDGMYDKNELDNTLRWSNVIELIFRRIEVINSAFYSSDPNIWIFYTDTGGGEEFRNDSPYGLSLENLKAFPLSDIHQTQQKLAQYPAYGVFFYTNEVRWNSTPTVYYHSDIRLPVLEYMREIYPAPLQNTP